MTTYAPEEQLAAKIIASLIYADFPGGPDLETDAAPLGLYAPAVNACRDPYENAAIMMPITGKLYDCPGDAATAWEGLRQMSGAATPYAKLDPLIRTLGGVQTKVEYVLPPGTPQTESAEILEKLKLLGYTFRLNSCNDTIEVNERPITDITKAEIRVGLRDIGLAKKIAAAEDAYTALAKKNSYHPVRDYLSSLKWDKDDHIGALAAFLHSTNPPIVYRDGTSMALVHVYLYRWLIGAVAKVFHGSQNPMLVLDGPQGIGKSTLAHWLCPLAGYFLEGPINVADKDSDIRLIGQWIWEVSELDATTRKADQSALKSFITKEVVTVRKAYGAHDIKKPAMASLIGTVNNTSGFLADETGSRRFLIVRLERIDRKYQQLDVAQLWAQAMALYTDGERAHLTSEESAMQRQINEGYQVETVLTDWLERAFFFGPEYDDLYSLAEIIGALEVDGVKLSGTEKSQTMELARILVQKKARKIELRQGNRWTHLQRRPR